MLWSPDRRAAGGVHVTDSGQRQPDHVVDLGALDWDDELLSLFSGHAAGIA